MLKKLGLFIVVCASLLLMTGCKSEKIKIEGTLEDLMAKLYETIPEDERPMMLMNTEVTEENVEYFLGSTDVEYEEALASEPGISSIAHSVVLLRAKENADIEKIKTTIKENINPRKWLCVGVEEKDIIVDNKGDLIVLILIEDSAARETIKESFDNL
ncbi:MAG: hypothetical protein E7164_04250 [Firmicutes bacterium]|nr:hypothetical protein [Bacillota bacterium]